MEKKIPRILAVDDEEMMGYLIQRIIRPLGYHVDWVMSCESALEKIECEQYDLILSDFKMPQMSGENFYREITARNQNLSNRLVFITGDTLNARTVRFLKKNHIPYLTKPFDIDKLADFVKRMVADAQTEDYSLSCLKKEKAS